jgi:hypothetical protein
VNHEPVIQLSSDFVERPSSFTFQLDDTLTLELLSSLRLNTHVLRLTDLRTSAFPSQRCAEHWP